ncbi:MAG: hypothetical protein PHH04_01575 [Thomasclavelia sp.]|jgi:hypothetical protein|nr:hypothetical protein [Thomasclavelia sp.]
MSRVDKYKDLREGIKDEAGINRDIPVHQVEEDEDDDFLGFINNDEPDEKEASMDDTLAQPLTYEQMKSNQEIDRALRSAKNKVGKDEKYNTRMDILNKIREPQASTIKIDNMDKYDTDEFAKGMILNHDQPQAETPVIEEEKPKMTLMERLAAMSPKEDADNAKKVLSEEEKEVEEVEKEPEEEKEEPVVNTNEKENLDDMLYKIKQKDAQRVKEATGKEIEVEKTKTYYNEIEDNNVTDEDEEIDDGSNAVKVLNYIISGLIIVLIVLFIVIIYQSFF